MFCKKCKKRAYEDNWWDFVKCSVCGQMRHVWCQVTLTEATVNNIHKGSVMWTCSNCKTCPKPERASAEPTAMDTLSQIACSLDRSTAKCEEIIQACTVLKEENKRLIQQVKVLLNQLDDENKSK